MTTKYMTFTEAEKAVKRYYSELKVHTSSSLADHPDDMYNRRIRSEGVHKKVSGKVMAALHAGNTISELASSTGYAGHMFFQFITDEHLLAEVMASELNYHQRTAEFIRSQMDAFVTEPQVQTS